MLTNPRGLNDVTNVIIGGAIDIHTETGPGLLEGVYTGCMVIELKSRGLQVERGVKIPLSYRGHTLTTRYYLDLRVNGIVIVEVKSVATLLPVHTAQILTYLKITNCSVGLLINFNVPVLRQGIRRVVRP